MALRDTPFTLYERDGLLAAVRERCEAASSGHGSSMFVTGDAGLGKTTLLEHLQAEVKGFRVGRGGGAPSESGLAFSVLLSALSELTGEQIPEMSPEPGQLSTARGSRFYGTLRRLESLREPSLILLDDLHWADVDSLELTAFLCRRVASLPVVLLGTLRRWPTTAYEIGSDLASAGCSTMHNLEPLSHEACKQLLGELTGRAPAPSLTEQVWHACAGNPLLVHQAASSIEADSGLPSLGTIDAGAQLLLSRFAGASTMTLSFARTASVFGDRFNPGLVQKVSGVTADEADRSLLALCRAGLVIDETTAWARFVHPLFRQILYQDLPGPIRARLHALAMRALLERGASAAEAAEHALLGGAIGDEAAIDVLTRAGRASISSGGVETAATQLKAAADLAGTNASADLLLALSGALIAAGRPGASSATAGRVLEIRGASPREKVQAHRLLAHAAFIAGRPRDALEQFDIARLEAIGLDRTTLLDTLLDAAFTLGTTARVPTLLAFALEARQLGLLADAPRHALAEVAWGSAAALGGDRAGLDAVLAAAEAAARQPGEQAASWAWHVHLAHMNAARQLERYDEACAVYDTNLPALERAGNPLPIVTMTIVHADTLKRLGRLLEASALLDKATGLIEFVPVGSAWLEMARADIGQELGEPVMLRCATVEASLGSQADSYPLLWLWLWAVKSDALVEEGHAEAAADLASQCRPLAESAGVRDPLVVPWARSALEAAIAANRLEQAEREVAWLEDAGSPMATAGHRALLAYGRALVSSRRQADDVEARFNEALSCLSTTTLPLLEARVQLAYGRHLRQSGRPAHARPCLARALLLAETTGAARLARAAGSELQTAGGRRRRRSDDPDRLTAQELRIVALALEGRTNPEIGRALYVSRKTVESHLGHIYAKLGISSRRELPLVASRLPASGDAQA